MRWPSGWVVRHLTARQRGSKQTFSTALVGTISFERLTPAGLLFKRRFRPWRPERMTSMVQAREVFR